MKCSKCDTELNDEKICSVCKNNLDLTDLNEDVSLEKTIAISNSENLSFIDEINKQIDSVNMEVKEESDILNEKNTQENDVLATVESFEKRKKIFMVVGFVILLFSIIAFILFMVLDFLRDKNDELDYVVEIDRAMQEYYDTTDINDILFVLEDIKNDKEVLKDVQAKTRTICNSWILHYLDEDINSKDEFEEVSKRYKDLIEGIYSYAFVKEDDEYIRLINESEYFDLLEQIDIIYNNGIEFYEAYDFYIKRDYNKAYYMFSKISNDNSYYDKSITYKDKIVIEILELLVKDISKLEENIEELDDIGKLERYTYIEEIILEYNNIYEVIVLNKNIEYQNILSKYTSKVSEYTEKVMLGSNN